MDDKEDDKEKEGSFWKTLPGYLTGCAAVITAITGIIAALVAAGIINPPSLPTQGPIFPDIDIFVPQPATSPALTGVPVGAITGRVTMQNGAPVDGAEVWLVDLPALKTTSLLPEGRYTLKDVPAGQHRVSAQKGGLGATKDVTVQAGGIITADLIILPVTVTPTPTPTPIVRATATPTPTRTRVPPAIPPPPTPRAAVETK